MSEETAIRKWLAAINSGIPEMGKHPEAIRSIANILCNAVEKIEELKVRVGDLEDALAREHEDRIYDKPLTEQ